MLGVGAEDRDGEHHARGVGRESVEGAGDGGDDRVRGHRTEPGAAAAVARQRLHQERVASTRGGEVAGTVERRRGLALAEELGGLEGGQRVEVHHRGARFRAEAGHAVGGAGRRVGARGRQHEQWHLFVVDPEEEVTEEVDGGGVGPVDVVDEHHRRRGAHVLEHEVGEREQLAGALALDDLGGVVGERFAEVGPGPFDDGDVGGAVAERGQRFRHRGEQRVAQGQVGEVEAVVAATALHRGPASARVFECLVGEARLADSRLAFDDDEVREPAQREVDAGAQPGELGPPSDQRARHRPSVQVGADGCQRMGVSGWVSADGVSGCVSTDGCQRGASTRVRAVGASWTAGQPTRASAAWSSDRRMVQTWPAHSVVVGPRRRSMRWTWRESASECATKVVTPACRALSTSVSSSAGRGLDAATRPRRAGPPRRSVTAVAEPAADADDVAGGDVVDHPRTPDRRRAHDVDEMGGGEVRERCEEPAVARSRAAPLEHGDEPRCVVGHRRPQHQTGPVPGTAARHQFESGGHGDQLACRSLTSCVVSALPPTAPLAAGDLFDGHPGDGAHGLALDVDHRLGETGQHLLLLVVVEHTLDQLHVHERHGLLLSLWLVGWLVGWLGWVGVQTVTVTCKKVAGMTVASSVPVVFCAAEQLLELTLELEGSPVLLRRRERVHRRPVVRAEHRDQFARRSREVERVGGAFAGDV